LERPYSRRRQFNYNVFLPAALALAHLARAAAAILARAAALNLRLALGDFLDPLTLAQRALCAAAILARPAALIPDFLLGAAEVAAPTRRLSWFCSESIFSFRFAM
jgi:hypothetical protein